MRRMIRRRSVMKNGTSTLCLVILMGDMLTRIVTSKPLNSRVKLSSLSKSEFNFDKHYPTGYQYHSVINNLPPIPKTSFYLSEISDQESLSRMKTTGHQSTELSQSSTYTVHKNDTSVGTVDISHQIYSIHPTAAKTTEDLTQTEIDLFSDFYKKYVHSSIIAGFNEDRKVSSAQPLSSRQHLLIPSFEPEPYVALMTPQPVRHALKSVTKIERSQEFSNSEHSTPTLHVDLSNRVDSVGTESVSPLSSVDSDSGHTDVFHTFTNKWPRSDTDSTRSRDDFQTIRNQEVIPTISLSTMSSVFDIHPSITSYWQSDISSLDAYSTAPLITTPESLLQKKHKNSHISTQLPHGLPARSERRFPAIESTTTDMFGSLTATLNSLDSSSALYVNREPTPTISTLTNRVIISTTMPHQSTFEAHHLKTYQEIFASNTLIAENISEGNDISETSSNPSIGYNVYSSHLMPSTRVAQGHNGNILPTDSDTHVIIDSLNTETEMKSNNPSKLQISLNLDTGIDSSEKTTTLDIITTPTLHSVSPVTIHVQPDVESSYSQANNILYSHIESDMSGRLLTYHRSEYSNTYVSTFTTESYTTPEHRRILHMEYPTSKHFMMIDSVLIGTGHTSYETQNAFSAYTKGTAFFNSVYQSKSSSILLLAGFAPSSHIAATRQYSSMDETNFSSSHYHNDVETESIQQVDHEKTTDMNDIIVKTNGQEIKIEININNNIVQEDRKSTTTTTSTTTQKPPQIPVELIVICAYMCQQRGSPIPPFCGCTLQAWLR